MNGWIKLHRSMLEWEWYDDWPCFRLFMHLLLTVNRKTTRYHGHEIPTGARVSGKHALSQQTGLSFQQVRTALKKLESTGEITTQKKGNFTIISVTNWNEYQENNNEITSKQQATNKQATSHQQQNGEGKNGKKDNTRAHSSDANLKPDDVSQETWNDFLQIRQAKKKPITQAAVKMLCTEAKKAGWSTESAVQEAAARGWQSFKASYVADQQTQPAKRKNPQPSEWGLL